MGFLLAWDHNLYAGWQAYGLGMAIGIVVLAKIIEVSDDPRAAVRVIPWSVFLALTHAMPVLFVGAECHTGGQPGRSRTGRCRRPS
jgi:hypothetical protein